MGKLQLSDQQWRERLTPQEYNVLRKAGTEPAWSGELLHVAGEGVFRCAGCGAELFGTDAKFDSGSGWPSFDRARSAGTIVEPGKPAWRRMRLRGTCTSKGTKRNKPPNWVRHWLGCKSSWRTSATAAATGRASAGRSSSRRRGKRAKPSSFKINETATGPRTMFSRARARLMS